MSLRSLALAAATGAAILAPGRLSAQQRPAAARPAGAAAQAPVRLGYINSRTILHATPGYQHAEYESARAEVAKLQGQLDSAAADFQSTSVVLSPTARQQKQQSLSQQQQQIEQRTQELQTKMQSRERELIEPFQTRIQAVIEGLRAEGNYAMIFDVSAMGGALVTADRSLDLTQTVIDRLQASK
jgi:Skp family chaperone for outer membrane proteins